METLKEPRKRRRKKAGQLLEQGAEEQLLEQAVADTADVVQDDAGSLQSAPGHVDDENENSQDTNDESDDELGEQVDVREEAMTQLSLNGRRKIRARRIDWL